MNQRAPANILLITSDHHRRNSAGCYGNRDVITPSMDRMACEGMRFTECLHAVDRANPGGQSNPSDWAIMIFEDNVITSKAVAANVAGHAYRVNFEAGAAVYNGSSQATQTGDALLIEVLRRDNSVLASTTNAPGAWTGKMTFTPASFQYKGDGSGDIRLRVGPAGTMNSGRFHGAIDNIMVREMK